MVKTQEIAINKILIDRGTQFRVGTNNSKVQEYQELLADSKGWPFDAPCIVFYDGTEYYLVDGFHRHHAAKLVERKKLTCEVISGSLREAIKFALSANAKHGIYRSNDDKRKAVSFALADEEWGKLSNRALAELCGVNEKLVRTMREEESTAVKPQLSETRIGLDGKERKLPRQPSHPQKVAQSDALDEVEDPGYDDCSVAVATIDEPEPVVEKKTKKQSAAEEAIENAHHIASVRQLAYQLIRAMNAVPEVNGTELYHARIRRLLAIVEPLKGALRACEPAKICSKCNGRGCAQCGNHGWLTSSDKE